MAGAAGPKQVRAAIWDDAMNGLRVLFAVHDWGLGHATRCLVLIRGLLDAGHSVTIVSHGRAIELLRQELDERCEVIELRDIPKPLSRRAAAFYVKMSLSMPQVFLTFRRERREVERLCANGRFDRIVSDSRFGICHDDVPSYYLFHSLRQIIPGRPRRLERMVELSQQRLLTNGNKILIPDEAVNGLAGDLCHNVDPSWNGRTEYIGILSSVERTNQESDIDYFVSVSGAEPQRTIFENMVLSQVRQLPGRVVVALGRPDADTSMEQNGRITVYSYLNRVQQQQYMNRARLVITRSGYTTLMELAELGKPALLVPTVGQSEQEYLARHHEERGNLHYVLQHKLNLSKDVEVAATYAGLPSVKPTRESVARFLSIVCG
jgi:UDP:flavonoid glycosyltransferase YjiC (YdhE family)